MTDFPDAPAGGVGDPGGPLDGGMPPADRSGAYPPAPPHPYQAGPYPPAPQQHWGFSAAPPSPKNGLGIASLIIAIIGVVLCVTIVGGVTFGVVAVILGLGGRTRVKRGEATNGGVAMTGIVLGIVAAILPVILVLAVVFGANLLNGDYQHCIGYHPGHEKSCDRYR